jgi:DNA-directed RNA polymerase specialized sigma24 family protein
LSLKRNNQHTAKQSQRYSIAADFCNAFNEQTDFLFTLAFLLTANHQLAERVFLTAFEDCLDGMPVFKECVPSWSKRAVIKAAIRTVRLPAKEASVVQKPETFPPTSLGLTIAAAIAKLPELNRFVYVLSVLERYSDRECSVLLDSTVGEIVRARNKALQQLANTLSRSGERAFDSLSRDEPDEFVVNCVNFHRFDTSNM